MRTFTKTEMTAVYEGSHLARQNQRQPVMALPTQDQLIKIIRARTFERDQCECSYCVIEPNRDEAEELLRDFEAKGFVIVAKADIVVALQDDDINPTPVEGVPVPEGMKLIYDPEDPFNKMQDARTRLLNAARLTPAAPARP